MFCHLCVKPWKNYDLFSAASCGKSKKKSQFTLQACKKSLKMRKE